MSGMGDNFSNLETSGDSAKVVSQQIVTWKNQHFWCISWSWKMSGMGDNFSNMETSGDIEKVVS